MSFRRLLPLVLTLLASVFSQVASADSAAQGFIREQQQKLTSALKNNSDSDIDSIFAEMIDYDTIARDSLGKVWSQLTEAQQAEFSCVLKQLVAQAYRRDLKKTLDYQVTFQGEEAKGDRVLVKTVAKNTKNPGEDPVSIDYLLHKVGGKWRVRDIRTEGVSLVGSYNNQFRKMIKKKGFGELISRMRSKLEAPAEDCSS